MSTIKQLCRKCLKVYDMEIHNGTLKNKTIYIICTNCGHIELYAPIKLSGEFKIL